MPKNRADITFYILIVIFAVVAFVFHDQPKIAMWIGFALAGYSAVANDSIQTLGTFISSNRKTKWWILWIFIGGIMTAVLISGWYLHSGDISYERLSKISEPKNFTIYHLIAPLALLVLTRLRMPVSTTFLLLSVFSNSETISNMLGKTLIGYIVAFFSALIIWAVIAEAVKHKRFFKEKYNIKLWIVLQWLTTGYLWTTWLMHDIANTAVYLPRVLNMEQMLYVIIFLVLAMGFLLFIKGGRIQTIITEKTDVVDIRSATLIDLVFATVLLIFKEWNNLPMSTTWVFLGLLAGREFAMAKFSGKRQPYMRTLGLVMKDVGLAGIGLVISILLAVLANGDLQLDEITTMAANIFN